MKPLVAFYRAHVHQIRGVVGGTAVYVASAGADAMLTWSWKRWLLAIACGLALSMRAGEFNPTAPPATSSGAEP